MHDEGLDSNPARCGEKIAGRHLVFTTWVEPEDPPPPPLSGYEGGFFSKSSIKLLRRNFPHTWRVEETVWTQW